MASDGNGKVNGNGRKLWREVLKDPRNLVLALLMLTGGGGAAYSGLTYFEDPHPAARSGSSRVDRLAQNERRQRAANGLRERIRALEDRLERLEQGLSISPLTIQFNSRLGDLEQQVAEIRGARSEED